MFQKAFNLGRPKSSKNVKATEFYGETPLVVVLGGHDCVIESEALRNSANVVFYVVNTINDLPKAVLEKTYGLILTWDTTQFMKDDIDKFKSLKMIVRAGSGTDNIDVQAATKRGIAVSAITGSHTSLYLRTAAAEEISLGIHNNVPLALRRCINEKAIMKILESQKSSPRRSAGPRLDEVNVPLASDNPAEPFAMLMNKIEGVERSLEAGMDWMAGQLREMDGQLREMDGQLREMDGQLREMKAEIKSKEAQPASGASNSPGVKKDGSRQL